MTLLTHTEATTEGAVDPQCMSYYLALRHLPTAGLEWLPGIGPTPAEPTRPEVEVDTADAILDALADAVAPVEAGGLLLSGGIDSAILAALVPAGTPCFTVAFDAEGAVDESVRAAAFAARWGLPHRIIRVRWEDYREHAPALMAAKSAPLHAIEVPLHLAALAAREAGVAELIVGNGADSTFGGMDKLLSIDWTFDAFVDRYCFADHRKLLADPREVAHVFEPYRRGDGIDVQAFLRERHGAGIVQSFENAIGSAGVGVSAPYELLAHKGPLDLRRIRSGEPKYLLAEIFRLLYDTDDVPSKIPFARPTDQWLSGWRGPVDRPEFSADAATHLLEAGGETRWLVWCLAEYCRQLEHERRGNHG